MNFENVLISVTGPSLTGKSNFEHLMVEKGCVALVSTTTRAARTGEQNGKHYHFVTREQFEKMQKEDGFIESEEVDGNWYGVQRQEALKAFSKRKPVVVVCEPKGALNIYKYAQKQGWHPFRVFLNNPQQLLVERFLTRFKEDSEATEERYAKRLINMLSKEKFNWVEPAVDGRAQYEAVFPSFNAENQEEVITRVLKEALSPKPHRVPKKTTPVTTNKL